MIKLKSATIKSLFGYEGNDYTVDFFPNEIITFVYALNGTGKTTVFKLIYAALKRQLSLLNSISFESLKITFNNDESLVIMKSSKNPITYYLENSEGKIISSWESPTDNNLDFFEYLKGFNTINILYANKDYDRLITDQISRRKKDNGLQIVGNFEEYELQDTIALDFNDVKKIYEKRRIEIDTMSDINFYDELFMRTSDDYDKEKKYIVFPIPDKISSLKEGLKFLFSENGQMLYLEHLDQFEENREKDLCLFEEIINHKPGLTDKDISINRKTGELEIRLFGRDDILLPPEKLSSGEKNWLLLNFHLIFKAKHGILFIDEPEVSMHSEWLINFVDNLKRICEGRDNQIIVATHSPSITYYDFDLMSELKKVKI